MRSMNMHGEITNGQSGSLLGLRVHPQQDLVRKLISGRGGRLPEGYVQDIADVEHLIAGGHITVKELRSRFKEIEPELIRYPAIDAEAFKVKMENLVRRLNERGE